MPYTRPGVYVEEQSLPNVVPLGSRVATGAFIGTADRGSTTPVRIDSWSQYVARFGGFSGTHDLPHSVYHYFANGGRVAWVTRAIGAGAAASDLDVAGVYSSANTAGTILTISAANPGTWGDSLKASVTELASRTGVFDLTVQYNNVQVEVWKDLSIIPTAPRYVETVVNSKINGSTYITATVPGVVETEVNSGGAVSFSAVSATSLSGGAAGSAPGNTEWGNAVTAQEAIEGPFLLNLAGQTTTTVINNAIAFAAARQDVFVIVDPDASASQSGTIGSIPSYTQSSFAAVYYPRLLMVDPSSTGTGGTRITFPGGAVMGRYVQTDASRGVFKAPAGISAQILGAYGLEYRPTDSEYGSLNDTNINAFRVITGSGVAIMGARTLKRDTIDMYIPARRTLIFLKKALEDVCRFAVFEPNDTTTWRSVEANCSQILNDLWLAGGLKGRSNTQAFFVVCDGSNNTPATIGAGELHVEIGVALQAPAEFVVIKLGLYSGGSSVTTEIL